eukprot:jgi/Psemu1/310339/fgenesh1_kg.622_\
MPFTWLLRFWSAWLLINSFSLLRLILRHLRDSYDSFYDSSIAAGTGSRVYTQAPINSTIYLPSILRFTFHSSSCA